MKTLLKPKKNCINEIVNIIKKYNISLDEIVTAYITKYENNFDEKEKSIYHCQFSNFSQYKHLFKEQNQKLLTQIQIIDDYIVL